MNRVPDFAVAWPSESTQTTQVKLQTVAAQLLDALVRQGLSLGSTSAVGRLLVAQTGLADV